MKFKVAGPLAYVRLNDAGVVQLAQGDDVPDGADMEHEHNQFLINNGTLVQS